MTPPALPNNFLSLAAPRASTSLADGAVAKAISVQGELEGSGSLQRILAPETSATNFTARVQAFQTPTTATTVNPDAPASAPSADLADPTIDQETSEAWDPLPSAALPQPRAGKPLPPTGTVLPLTSEQTPISVNAPSPLAVRLGPSDAGKENVKIAPPAIQIAPALDPVAGPVPLANAPRSAEATPVERVKSPAKPALASDSDIAPQSESEPIPPRAAQAAPDPLVLSAKEPNNITIAAQPPTRSALEPAERILSEASSPPNPQPVEPTLSAVGLPPDLKLAKPTLSAANPAPDLKLVEPTLAAASLPPAPKPAEPTPLTAGLPPVPKSVEPTLAAASPARDQNSGEPTLAATTSTPSPKSAEPTLAAATLRLDPTPASVGADSSELPLKPAIETSARSPKVAKTPPLLRASEISGDASATPVAKVALEERPLTETARVVKPEMSVAPALSKAAGPEGLAKELDTASPPVPAFQTGAVKPEAASGTVPAFGSEAQAVTPQATRPLAKRTVADAPPASQPNESEEAARRTVDAVLQRPVGPQSAGEPEVERTRAVPLSDASLNVSSPVSPATQNPSVTAAIAGAAQAPIAPTSPSPINTVAPSAALSPAVEEFVERIADAREGARTTRPELTLRHSEFGSVAVRLETSAGAGINDWRATLSARDPGFVPAVNTALADRALTAASEAGLANQNGGFFHRGQEQGSSQSNAQSGSQSNPQGFGGSLSGGSQSGQDPRYGSSTGAGQGSAKPYSGEEADSGSTRTAADRGDASSAALNMARDEARSGARFA